MDTGWVMGKSCSDTIKNSHTVSLVDSVCEIDPQMKCPQTVRRGLVVQIMKRTRYKFVNCIRRWVRTQSGSKTFTDGSFPGLLIKQSMTMCNNTCWTNHVRGLDENRSRWGRHRTVAVKVYALGPTSFVNNARENHCFQLPKSGYFELIRWLSMN